MGHKPDEAVIEDNEEKALRQDILGDVEPVEYPARLDWLASYLDRNEDYTLNPQRGMSDEFISDFSFKYTAEEPYLEGLAALTGSRNAARQLEDRLRLADVAYQYAALVNGLENVGREDVDPGEVLGRLVVRHLQRQRGATAHLAEDLQPNTNTPRELLMQLAGQPELAAGVEAFIEDSSDRADLTTRLGQVQLATRLWDHQREGLYSWLMTDGHGYVNMATATGKTVLGLAAVGYCTDSGALHPDDGHWLDAQFDGEPPTVANTQADDVLIVTRDDLLGAQWAELFERHCHTPPEYTRIVDGSIRLPWGDINIRAANALSGLDPSDYRLAIFDEVHNYARSSGFGEELERFIKASCPVLALTGSERDELIELAASTDGPFEKVYEYSHEDALADGVIPGFEWTLDFVPLDQDRSSTYESLQQTAQVFDPLVDASPDGLTITDAAWEETSRLRPESLDRTYDTPGRLAAGLRDAGENDRPPTRDLDTLARGLDGRQTHWWNLRPSLDPVCRRLANAMDAARPALVLTRSYPEADTVHTVLSKWLDADRITTLEQGMEADEQAARINEFDADESGRKVLIGPGKRLGTGVDIPSLEVGINLAQPGTGVNATLVQRIGRLLRQTDGDASVEFYHVLGVPPLDALIHLDGPAFIEDVVEFFAEADAPGADGMTKVPDVSIEQTVVPSVAQLETWGAQWRSSRDRTTPLEQAYLDAINRTSRDEPAVLTDWYPNRTAPISELDSSSTGDQPQSGGDDTTASSAESDSDGVSVDTSDTPTPNGITPMTLTHAGDPPDGDRTLCVSVESEETLPVKNAVVSVDTANHTGVATTTDGGVAEFDGLTPGPVTVAVTHPGFSVQTEESVIDGRRLNVAVTLPNAHED